MSGPEAAVAEAQPNLLARVSEFTSNHIKPIIAVGAAGLAAAGIGVGIKVGGGKENPFNSSPAAAAIASGADCENLQVGDVAVANFATGKFLPAVKGQLSNNNEAAAYTQDLFRDAGPLGGGKVDPASLAVMDAAINYPAREENTNNSYSYVGQFRNDLNKLKNGTASEAFAQQLCEQISVVMAQTVGYDDHAIAKGAPYTKFNAVDGPNGIVDMKPDQTTAGSTISGATFKVYGPKNLTNKAGLNGFTEVVVEADGSIDILGHLPTAAAHNTARHPKPNGNRHERRQAHGGGGGRNQRHQAAGGNSQREQNTHSGAKENRPNGQIPGTHHGPASGKPGGHHQAQPGPGPSPSGGEKTPPSSSVPPTTQETTPTPPPTTNTTPTPPPTTETTPPPKGTPPPCVSNPPYVIC
jgi:hypothetical protein